MKLICKEDCNNAPKKQYILDFNIAFANADTEKILDMLDDNAVWHMVGVKILKDKESIRKQLELISTNKAEVLNIENILSHGKMCSANGQIYFTNHKVAFCDVYTFSSHSKNAKIKAIQSYVIDIL